MGKTRSQYVGDFETTVTPDDVRVWASCLVNIDTLETSFKSNNIESFFEFLRDKNSIVYFHNLKFDGEYLLSYLLSHGFKYSDSREDNTFDTLITDDGVFYSITVIFKKMKKRYHKVVFYDSYKKLPFKVSVIAKAFELEDQKGEIDYKKHRPVGYEPDENEWDYIIKDCRIVANALQIQFDKGLKKMTNASDALHGYKEIIDPKNFERWFPILPVELDAEIRMAYKGGFTYLNPRFRNLRIKGGVTLDVNSLYPWAMYNSLLPYGYPMYFEGEYEPDPNYPVYICRIRCAFRLKEGHIPTIQLKNNRAFVETEYLTSSNDEIVEMTVTSVDLQLIYDHYNLYCFEMVGGYKFKAVTGLFKTYIDYWMGIKETTKGAMRQLAKLMLNSLYGKFATNPKARKKIPVIDGEGVVRYILDDPELRETVYTAMACFITSYARERTVRSAQSVYDRFIYADTDSLHLTGTDIPEGLEVHPTKLGAWKHEGTFIDSKFIRAKTYIETMDGEGVKVTCAGMPDNVKEQVTYDNFHSGSTFFGKLMPRRFKGGIVLQETTFTIK